MNLRYRTPVNLLRHAIEERKRHPSFPVSTELLTELLAIIEEQGKQIRTMDHRLAGLMDRLPEDLLAAFSAEVVADMTGGDENEV